MNKNTRNKILSKPNPNPMSNPKTNPNPKYQIFKWAYVRMLKEPPDLALLDDRLIPRMCCSELYKRIIE